MPLLFVNHHYFRVQQYTQGIYPVSAQVLHEEITELRKRGWTVVEPDFVRQACASEGIPAGRFCCITFDDGFREQMAAVELLGSLGVRPLIFVPEAVIDARELLDVHRLQLLRAHLPDEEIHARLISDLGLNERMTADEQHAAEAQYRYDSEQAREVKFFLNFIATPSERASWTKEAVREALGPEEELAAQLYMSSDDVRVLGGLGVVGSHARSHVALATLDDRTLEEELVISRRVLESLTEASVWALSYPFGGRDAVDARVVACADRSGYEVGLTMQRGVNEGNLAARRLEMRRIDVNDLSGFW